jgi:hypothetical protein
MRSSSAAVAVERFQNPLPQNLGWVKRQQVKGVNKQVKMIIHWNRRETEIGWVTIAHWASRRELGKHRDNQVGKPGWQSGIQDGWSLGN